MAAKVKKRQSRKPVTTGTWVLLLSLFMVELLLSAWFRVHCVQTGYAIGKENRKAQELVSLQNSLRIELARLKAPERISYIARNQLGLNMPGPEQTIVVP